jgi:hypothetical protein
VKQLMASLSMAMLLLASGPAIAHHKTDHERGPKHEQGPQGETHNTEAGTRTTGEEQWPGIHGKSPSVPDSDGTGADHGEPGSDKQHDGNNGCGNEPASEGHPGEDDNNGWCGRPPEKGVGHTPTPTPSPVPSVSPSVIATSTPTATPTAQPSVLPTQEVRRPAPAPSDGGNLPFTGASGVLTWVLIGGVLLIIGSALWAMFR